jgi:hypothetical protein
VGVAFSNCQPSIEGGYALVRNVAGGPYSSTRGLFGPLDDLHDVLDGVSTNLPS